MDIEGRRRSSNIEDRRGSRLKTGAGLGLGGIVLFIVLSLLGINPLPFLEMTQSPQVTTETSDQPYQESADEAKLRQIVEVVVADTEDTWSALLPKYGVQYVAPKLVLFNEATQSECGVGQSAMGPFYCPLDQKVYLDLSFYRDLAQRFGAPGDSAQAYVIAHEIGHHVQNLVGTAQQVSDLQQRVDQTQANALSVRLELQADCFAGVWARSASQSLNFDESDVSDALRAAAAIGDDRLQRGAQGRITPDSFTHGSSQQRETWLRRGMQTGDPAACDTFKG